MLTFQDLPTTAYELSEILRHEASYKLIDFLARVQVVVVACMAEEHADREMVQRAIAGELESDEQAAL